MRKSWFLLKDLTFTKKAVNQFIYHVDSGLRFTKGLMTKL